MNKIRFFGLLACIAICFLISSCSSTAYVSFEVMKPPKDGFDHSVKNIVIVNSTNHSKYSSIINGKARNLKDSVKFELAQLCIDSLVAEIQPTSRFDTITLHDHNGELSIENARYIIDRYKADGLIVLDATDVSIVKKVRQSSHNQNIYNGNMILLSTFKWKLYSAEKDEFIDQYYFKYDDKWSSQSWDPKEAYNKLPVEKKVADELYVFAGKWTGRRLVPQWKTQSREFYTSGNDQMLVAAEKAKKNQWAESEAIWKTYSTSSNRHLAQMALYNLALASEMQGRLEDAFKLARSCSKEYGNTKAKDYADILYLRIEEQKELKKQLDKRI